jgi:hypothetical protein
LSNETVEVGVGWAFDVEGTTADIVDSFVVKHDSDVSVLQERVSGQHGVVWLNNSGGDLRGWVDGESKLGFFAVVNGKSLEEERSETRSSTTTNGVEDEKSLETSTVVSQFTDSVEAEVHDFFTDGVMTTSKVVGSILLSRDQLFRVEQLTVSSSTDFIDHGWLEIEEDASRDVLASTSLGEEGVESIITTTDGLVGWHLAVRLNTMLEAVEFPAGVTYLDASLADVNGDHFTHLGVFW